MRNILFYPFILLLIISACASEPQSSWKPMNLLEYGVPITIMAPDSADVKTMDFGLQKDITITKGKDFSLQIYASDATTADLAKVKELQLAMVKDNRYFNTLVEDTDNGFIYKTQIDSTKTNYGFRYIKLQGDKEYIFRTGLIGSFSEEQVRSMYEAVKGGK